MSDTKNLAFPDHAVAPMKDANFDTGAVRSADVDHLDFASMPLMGLLGVIAVAGKGGIKYGRHNYSKGIPNHVTLNHMAAHLIRYILGDRTEDHMSKVAWGAMVVNETEAKQPELSAPHMLGPGATLTEPMLCEMERTKPERDRARQAGEFEHLFDGTFTDMPEVKAILGQRKKRKGHKEWARVVTQTLRDYLKERSKGPYRYAVNFDGSARFNGPPENGFRKPETVACPETAKQYVSEVMANAEALTRPVDGHDFVTCVPTHEGWRKVREAFKSGPMGVFVAAPEPMNIVDPAPESLKEWCNRNPMSADVIQAKTLGLSGTGCPEPYATLPPNPARSTPGGYFPKPRTPSHVPIHPTLPDDSYQDRVNEASGQCIKDACEAKARKFKLNPDHMGGCPPLP